MKNKGFSLIEILVVVAIIGVLSTIAIAAVTVARGRAMDAKAEGDLDAIYKAITMLENDTGEWPNHQPAGFMCDDLPSCPSNNEICQEAGCPCKIDDPCSGLVETDGSYVGWNGPYITSIPLDPWGNEYFMDTDYVHSEYGNSVILGSYGPNGVGRNQYDSDDIIKKLD